MSRKNTATKPMVVAHSDVAKWAARQPKGKGGTTCTLCAAAPAVGRDIATVLKMRKDGLTQVGQRAFCAYLTEKFKINVLPSTLVNHLQRHLRTTW